MEKELGVNPREPEWKEYKQRKAQEKEELKKKIAEGIPDKVRDFYRGVVWEIDETAVTRYLYDMGVYPYRPDLLSKIARRLTGWDKYQLGRFLTQNKADIFILDDPEAHIRYVSSIEAGEFTIVNQAGEVAGEHPEDMFLGYVCGSLDVINFASRYYFYAWNVPFPVDRVELALKEILEKEKAMIYQAKFIQYLIDTGQELP